MYSEYIRNYFEHVNYWRDPRKLNGKSTAFLSCVACKMETKNGSPVAINFLFGAGKRNLLSSEIYFTNKLSLILSIILLTNEKKSVSGDHSCLDCISFFCRRRPNLHARSLCKFFSPWSRGLWVELAINETIRHRFLHAETKLLFIGNT